MAYGLLTDSLTLWPLRNAKFRLMQQEITGLSEVFRERMFLHSEDYREGTIIRSVRGDPLGGEGMVQYEMTLTPEGITLWGIDNGSPV